MSAAPVLPVPPGGLANGLASELGENPPPFPLVGGTTLSPWFSPEENELDAGSLKFPENPDPESKLGEEAALFGAVSDGVFGCEFPLITNDCESGGEDSRSEPVADGPPPPSIARFNAEEAFSFLAAPPFDLGLLFFFFLGLFFFSLSSTR